MPDGRWRFGGVFGGIPAPIPYILRKGIPGMENPNRGVALKEREVQLTQEQFPLLQSYGQAAPKPIAFFLKQLYSVVSYRRPMTVKEYLPYRDAFGRESVYYICPHCDVTLEREYQAYCDRCGQRLDWKSISRTTQRKSTI